MDLLCRRSPNNFVAASPSVKRSAILHSLSVDSAKRFLSKQHDAERGQVGSMMYSVHR